MGGQRLHHLFNDLGSLNSGTTNAIHQVRRFARNMGTYSKRDSYPVANRDEVRGQIAEVRSANSYFSKLNFAPTKDEVDES
jgi:hypothetical protein